MTSLPAEDPRATSNSGDVENDLIEDPVQAEGIRRRTVTVKNEEKKTSSTMNSDSRSEETTNIEQTEDEKSEDRGGASGGEENSRSSTSAFECNICLDVASDAVISMCGHLFCWPCLHTWLETRPNRQICPVCKAGIGRDKVVPLYGRGDTKDPRDVPPRPRGQRPEPESSTGGTGSGFGGFGGFGGGGGGGFQMSFGIGAFPFGFFATNFNLGGDQGGVMRGGGAQEGTAQYEQEQFVHRIFLWVAFAFIFWLLIA